MKYDSATVLDRLMWYVRTMTPGAIPPGVTVNLEDLRAEQSCEVCSELVDAWSGPFSATRCAHHQEAK